MDITAPLAMAAGEKGELVVQTADWTPHVCVLSITYYM